MSAHGDRFKSPDAADAPSEMLVPAIKQEAYRLGFDLAGIAPAISPHGLQSFLQWLDDGHAGEMSYLPRRRDAYSSPASVLDGARSVIMLAISYHQASVPAIPERTDDVSDFTGKVASYAAGNRDYHDVIREKLNSLAEFVESQIPDCRTRGVVDTAPLLERDFARLAGLGWFGKNTMLLNRRLGSWFFLAALLVDCELEYDPPQATSHCGTCTRCLDACPTDAFVGPYVLDARRCISYLTIEHRGAIPADLRDGMGEWLFGCDICQDVCPWNRKAQTVHESAFAGTLSLSLPLVTAQSDLSRLDGVELLQLDDAAFRASFRNTPLWRPKRAGLLRNACIVLGNRRDRRAVPPLVTALGDSDPVVRGAAAWALGKLGGADSRSALEGQLVVELDSEVREEITEAIASIVL